MKTLIKTLALVTTGFAVGVVVLKQVSSISELEAKNADGNYAKINNSPQFSESIGKAREHYYTSGNKKFFISK